MRILMLAHRIPYPPDTGDKIRAYHIVRYLARRHDVTLGCLVDDRTDLSGVSALREEVGDLEFSQIWKPWGLLKGVVGLATGNAISVRYFRSGALRRRVARRVSATGYDLVYASSTPMAQYAQSLGLPMVMDFVDVDSDKWTQYGRYSRGLLRWAYELEGRRLQDVEARIARWSDRCVLATRVEETLLKSFAPWAKTEVIPNGIDLEYFRSVAGESSPPGIIFTGAMDYLPNVDAVKYFCHEVLPLVRRTIPEIPFYIVGLNPHVDVQRLAGIRGVVVTGRVADVRPYYYRSSVCVAPLRMGRGVQNKVLQAMAMGLPVVASSPAHRGLDAKAGEHLHVEDEASGFADKVVRLLSVPEEGQAMARRARAFVEVHHAWATSCARLERILQSVARNGSHPAQAWVRAC